MQDLFCLESFSDDSLSELFLPTYLPPLHVSSSPDPSLSLDPRVIANMLGQEEPCSKADYFSTVQRELRPHMRRIVTDWMLEVCEDQEAGPEVFLLAVHYLDTFLSTTAISKSQFQLVAATCLLLASKFSAVVAISALQLVLYTDHSVTVEELVQWEQQVLNSLQWQLSTPTSNSFLEQLVARLPSLASLPAPHLARLQDHARTLTTIASTEYSLLLAPRSIMAGAALTAAHSGLGLPASDILATQVAELLGCPRDQVVRSTTALESILRPAARTVKDYSVSLPTFNTLPKQHSGQESNTPTNFPNLFAGQGNTTPTNITEVLSAIAA